MNNERRKRLRAIFCELDTIFGQLDTLKDQLGDLRDEEQEAFDNMPESLQDGDRGQAMQSAIEAMETAHGALDEINVDDVLSSIDQAVEAQ